MEGFNISQEDIKKENKRQVILKKKKAKRKFIKVEPLLTETKYRN